MNPLGHRSSILSGHFPLAGFTLHLDSLYCQRNRAELPDESHDLSGNRPLNKPTNTSEHEWNDYELLDYGEGRKLERWGSFWLDRPSPAAEPFRRTQPELWDQVAGRFIRTSGEKGQWRWEDRKLTSWRVHFAPLTMEVAPTPFGHLGLFPEQADNWRWLLAQTGSPGRSLKILNLFAYTGGSTLAAAGPSHEVVHVDASKSSVTKARRNAALSHLETCNIRWIIEDVLKFCQREVRRGHRYDAFILDPPTYGHGPKGERWQIEQHLPELLGQCAELWSGEGGFFLLTCHSESVGLRDANRLVGDLLSRSRPEFDRNSIEVGPMNLTTQDRRCLNSGLFARCALEATSP